MKILLVDDDQLITESLEIILSKDESFEIVGKCSNGQEALEFTSKQDVDLILMDIRMPVMDGIEACANIKKMNPSIKIIMLTTFRDFRHIHQALHAGASGYLLKSDDVDKQIHTIKNVFEGQAIISEEALIEFTSAKMSSLLSERENSCMELVAHGYSNKEIAKRVYISEGTVRNVISIILEKLSLRDRTQIAIYYWQTIDNQSSKN
ncbi:MAG: response regulator [Candidatus Izemoplasmataceae bacterium]|jgi:two-component system, NarL family, response regulator LiaR|uniref:response regulator n=1 Tax=Liberiplasma polymorphum TaxID=3374570 RepID=UPI003770F7B7